MDLSETVRTLSVDQARAFGARVNAALSVRPGGELVLEATPDILNLSTEAYEQLLRGVAAVNEAIAKKLLRIAPDLSVSWTAPPALEGEYRHAPIQGAGEGEEGWIDLNHDEAVGLAVLLGITGVALIVVTGALLVGTIFFAWVGNPSAAVVGLITTLVAGALCLMAFHYAYQIGKAVTQKGVRIRFRTTWFLGIPAVSWIEIVGRT